jgi:hypothetical protein
LKLKSHIYQRIVLILLATLLSWSAYSQCAFTNLNDEYCANDADVTLTGGTNYYGPGVTGSTFSPSAAGAGVHRIFTTDGTANTYNIVTSGNFNRLSDTGTIIPLTQNSESVVALPFTFNFFGNNYNSIRIGSNLLVGFTDAVTASQNRTIPNVAFPDNIIAAAWDAHDIDAGSTIKYFTTGTSPNRIFVIDYDAVPRDGGAYDNTVQIQLHETSNIIEIHSTSVLFATGGNFGSQGIENSTASLGYVVPGRNDQGWDATSEYIAFVPTCTDIKYVTVIEAPTVEAGSNEEICEDKGFFSFSSQSTGASVSNYSSFSWLHSGTGNLLNGNTLTPTYIPGVNETGVINFNLSATGNGSCGVVIDNMTLTITDAPTADAGLDVETCEDASLIVS